MKLTRKEYDEIGELLIRKAKEIDPTLKTDNLLRIFGRTYARLLKESKEAENI